MQRSRVTRRLGLEGVVMKLHILSLALLSVITVVASAPAHTPPLPLTRTFVSSTGARPLILRALLRSRAPRSPDLHTEPLAVGNTSPRLIPANMGRWNILYPVTIDGNGWAAITGTPNGAGITVNTFTGHTNLIDIRIDSANAALQWHSLHLRQPHRHQLRDREIRLRQRRDHG